MKTITFKATDYNLETYVSNAEYLVNKETAVSKKELSVTVYRSAIAFNIYPKDITKKPLRLKVFIKSENIVFDIQEALTIAFDKINAKITSHKYLTLYKNEYSNDTFYTLEPLFNSEKVFWN